MNIEGEHGSGPGAFLEWEGTPHYLSCPYSYPTLPYPTLPYPTLPYPILPYHTIPYPTIPYPTIPYHTVHLCIWVYVERRRRFLPTPCPKYRTLHSHTSHPHLASFILTCKL